MKNKYIIATNIMLWIICIISIPLNFVYRKTIKELSDNAKMWNNSKSVCQTKYKELSSEYERLERVCDE